MIELLNKNSIPLVLVDRSIPGEMANFAGVNHDEIGFLATAHLIAQGCKRVVHLRGPAVSTGRGRLRGYRRALAKHKLAVPPQYVIGAAYQDSTGYLAMQRLLQMRPRPDGVFCYNDPVAIGAMKAILEAGLGIPGEITIVGAGNVSYSEMVRVPLSTIDQSSFRIGQSVAELLLESMETPLRSKRILVPPRLVVRESSMRQIGTHRA